mmetsp:Transcript_4882/g.7895  ORF Transcript_4882/g.7895 Transcript_4882/m.7895 type:complete len:116 (+) Transcript_4882:677-1024(+)
MGYKYGPTLEVEECMTFALSNSGKTKSVRRSRWGECVRLVSKTNSIAMAAPKVAVAPQGTVPFPGEEEDDDDDLASCFSMPSHLSNVGPTRERMEEVDSPAASSKATEEPVLHFC